MPAGLSTTQAEGRKEAPSQPSAERGLQGGELACLGSAEDIPACEEMGYGPGLHLGHVHKAHLLDGLLRLGRQLQGGKLCVAHDPAHCRSMPLHAITRSASLGLKQGPSCESMCMWDVSVNSKQADAVVIVIPLNVAAIIFSPSSAAQAGACRQHNQGTLARIACPALCQGMPFKATICCCKLCVQLAGVSMTVRDTILLHTFLRCQI